VSTFGLPTTGGFIDAAAAFAEQTVPKDTTAAFSLHATKMVGAGEGGYIVTHDRDAAREYRRMTNFGLHDGVSRGTGTNAKMSEYHAAVALCSLDAYDREAWLRLHDWYAKHLPPNVVQQKRPRGAYPIIAVKLPVPAQPVLVKMRSFGIECRRWYCPPLSEHPLFVTDNWRERLPVTADLSEHLLGLPWHLYLTEEDVIAVCLNLRKAIADVEDTFDR
jgi:dTDP-4-amino-4,6-dideoxygalactose transaminase